jgi:hypothetical protein
MKTTTTKSKYRFSKLECYLDKDGKKYFYEGKAGGCFYFTTIFKGNFGHFSGYERHLDDLNLTLKIR